MAAISETESVETGLWRPIRAKQTRQGRSGSAATARTGGKICRANQNPHLDANLSHTFSGKKIDNDLLAALHLQAGMTNPFIALFRSGKNRAAARAVNFLPLSGLLSRANDKLPRTTSFKCL